MNRENLTEEERQAKIAAYNYNKLKQQFFINGMNAYNAIKGKFAPGDCVGMSSNERYYIGSKKEFLQRGYKIFYTTREEAEADMDVSKGEEIRNPWPNQYFIYSKEEMVEYRKEQEKENLRKKRRREQEEREMAEPICENPQVVLTFEDDNFNSLSNKIIHELHKHKYQGFKLTNVWYDKYSYQNGSNRNYRYTALVTFDKADSCAKENAPQ